MKIMSLIAVFEIANKCKTNNLDFVVGGGVSDISIEPLKKIKESHLSRFETRKIIFQVRCFRYRKEDQRSFIKCSSF